LQNIVCAETNENATEFLNQTLYWQGILPVECLKHVSSLATITKSESEF